MRGAHPHARRAWSAMVEHRLNKPVTRKNLATRRYLGKLVIGESVWVDKMVFLITKHAFVPFHGQPSRRCSVDDCRCQENFTAYGVPSIK
jgi:hypothetical protein